MFVGRKANENNRKAMESNRKQHKNNRRAIENIRKTIDSINHDRKTSNSKQYGIQTKHPVFHAPVGRQAIEKQ